MKDKAPRRVVFFHLAAIGDFLLAVPAVRALRTRFPKAEFHICARAGIRDLAIALGIFQDGLDPEHIDLHRLFIPAGEIPSELTQVLSGFDLGITTSWNPDFRGNLERYLPGVLAPPRSPDDYPGHLQDFFIEHLFRSTFGDIFSDEGVMITDERLREAGRNIFTAEGADPGLVVHPGAGGRIKHWPIEQFFRVSMELKNMGIPPVFILGPAEDEFHEFRGMKNRGQFPVFSGCSLLEVAEIIAASRGYLGNDSGITHLAAALGVPTVAVFGPSDPRKYGPRGAHVKIISLWYGCSPCFPKNKFTDSRCSQDRACLTDIPPEAVIEAARSLLE